MANRNNIDFMAQMEAGKQIAMDRRNKGLPTGKSAKGWKFKRLEPQGLDRLEFEYNAWRKEWQYQALAAVETALFAHEYDEFLEAEGWQ